MAGYSDAPLLPMDLSPNCMPPRDYAITRDPRRLDPVHGLSQGEIAWFIPAKRYSSLSTHRGILHGKNPLETEHTEDEIAVITLRVCTEFLTVMLQTGMAGTPLEVDNPDYIKYKQKYGARTELMAQLANGEVAGEDAMALDGAKFAPPPPPPMAKIPSDSIMYEEQNGELKEKVGAYLLPIFYKQYDTVHLHYHPDNIAGIVFVVFARNHEFTFEDAAKKLTETHFAQLQEKWSSQNRGKPAAGASFDTHMREGRRYGIVAEDGSVHGYEKIRDVNSYNFYIHDTYARMHKLPTARKPYDMSAFSLASLEQILSQHDPPVLADQLKWEQIGVNAERVMMIPTYCYAAALDTRQICFDYLAQRRWPWETYVEEALRDPLNDHPVFDMFDETKRAARGGSLQSLGISALADPSVEQTIERPYVAARKFYNPFITQINNRIEAVLGIIEAAEERVLKRVKDDPALLKCAQTIISTGAAKYVADDPIMAIIKRLHDLIVATNQPVMTQVEFHRLKKAAELALSNRARVLERMEVVYARFMRVGNRELPKSLRGFLYWLAARDMKLHITAVTISTSLDPFANLLASFASMYAIGHSLAGSMGSVLTLHMSMHQATNHNKKSNAMMMMYGPPGTGKSARLKAIRDSHVPGTTIKKSAGGSNKADIFEDDPEGETNINDEAPPWLVADRNKLHGAAEQQHVTALELATTTDDSAVYHMVQQYPDPVTGKSLYMTTQRKIRLPAQSYSATNVVPRNPAVRSRSFLIPTYLPPGGMRAAIEKHMFVVAARVHTVRDVLDEYTQTLQTLVAAYRYAEGMRLVPPADLALFEVMMHKQTVTMNRWGFSGAMEPRIFNSAADFANCAMMEYGAFVVLSEGSSIADARNLRVDDQGEPTMDPVKLDFNLVKAMVPYLVSNQAVAMYASMTQFHNIVNDGELSFFRIIFSHLLEGGALTPDRLARWVRYVGMMDCYVRQLDEVGNNCAIEYVEAVLQDGGPDGLWPYFMVRPGANGNPEDPRQAFAFGSITTRRQLAEIKEKDYMSFVSAPGSIPTARSQAPRPRYAHGAQNQGAVMLEFTGTQRFNGASTRSTAGSAPQTPAAAVHTDYVNEPTIACEGTRTIPWRTVHPFVRGSVPERPGTVKEVITTGMTPRQAEAAKKDAVEKADSEKIFAGASSCLQWRVVKNEQGVARALDPNYIRLRVHTPKQLVSEIARLMRDNGSSSGLSNNTENIKNIVDGLLKRTIDVHSIRNQEMPPGWLKEPFIHPETFARAYLAENANEKTDSKFMLVEDELQDDSGKTTPALYILAALLPMFTESLKEQYLSVFSHSTTREMAVSLGPSTTSTRSILEMYHLRKSPQVLVIGSSVSRNERVENLTARRSILGSAGLRGKKTYAEDYIMPASSSYRTIETDASASYNPLREVTRDIEEMCSERWRLRNNVKADALPANVLRRIKDCYAHLPQDSAAFGLLMANYARELGNTVGVESSDESVSTPLSNSGEMGDTEGAALNALAETYEEANASQNSMGQESDASSPPPYIKAVATPLDDKWRAPESDENDMDIANQHNQYN